MPLIEDGHTWENLHTKFLITSSLFICQGLKFQSGRYQKMNERIWSAFRRFRIPQNLLYMSSLCQLSSIFG
jgi:hypothetical protein